MRYVGYAALVATFWLLVATVRLIVHDDCADRHPVVAPNASVSNVVRAPLPPALIPDVPSAPTRAIEEPAVRRGPWECNEPLYDLEPPYRRKPRGAEEPCAADGHPLSKVAIVAGMNALRPQIAACYRRYQLPGVAMVNVVIGKSGRVTSAVAVGRFAGTPTGACVEAAAKTARFPTSDGLRTPYPFYLR